MTRSVNQAVVVTGCSKRVGLDLAAHLSASGYQVVGAVRSIPKHPLPRIRYIEVDLACNTQISQFIQLVRAEYPNLRGIIHNASQWLEDSPANLDLMHRIHVAAPYRINSELSDLILQATRCDIIHICDDTASRGSANHIAYAATKAALLNMTLSFAKLYPEHVRVNAISPGLLHFKEGSSEEYQSQTVLKAKLGFEPKSEPIISAVDYLLNTNYVTGSNIVANGGRHLK